MSRPRLASQRREHAGLGLGLGSCSSDSGRSYLGGKRPRLSGAFEASRERELLSLEGEIRRLKLLLEEEQLLHEQSKQKLSSHERKARGKIERLEDALEKAQRDEETARKELREKEVVVLKEKHELEDKMFALEKDVRAKQNLIESERESAQSSMQELQNQIEDLRNKGSQLALKVATLQEELDEKQSQEKPGLRSRYEDFSPSNVLQLQSSVKQLERENFELRTQVEELKSGFALSERSAELRVELEESQKRCRRFQTELRQVAQHGTELLEAKETIRDLRSEIERLKGRNSKLLAAEAEKDSLAAEKREWAAQLMGVLVGGGDKENTQSQAASLEQVLAALSGQQNDLLRLTKLKGELEIRLQSRTRELKQAKEELTDLNHSKDESSLKVVSLTEEKRALESKCEFLTKERDSLLRVIESVGKEDTAISKKKLADDDVVDVTSPSQSPISVSVEGLETSVEYKQQYYTLKDALARANSRIALLESQAQKLRKNGSPALMKKASKQSDKMKEKIVALQEANSALQAKLEEAEEKVEELEHTLSKGAHDPSKTKVLHMAFNPARMSREAKAKQLENEIAALRKRNADLAEQLRRTGGASGEPVSVAAGGIDGNKRHERLKTLFKEQTKAFKEAVYLLTGYKIDMTQDKHPQLRIRSMFAESEEDHLLFRWQPESGGLEMLETEFCRKLDKDMFGYLQKCNSVPAFLATITLDLFERQTFLA